MFNEVSKTGQRIAPQDLVVIAQALMRQAVPRTLAGEAAGHPFHGNQWTGGIGGTAHQEYNRLKKRWAEVNHELLEMLDTPDSPKAIVKMNELKGLVKKMHKLPVDPGGLEGIGLPGGPRDMVVIGAGPGGLAAAVMGGTDGLDTLFIDANTVPGGQMKFSSRVENYPGFPIGATGEQLASSLYEQAERVGAEAKMGVRVVGMTHDEETGLKTLTLDNGETIEARAVVIAGGVEFSKLDFPGSDSDKISYGDGKKLSAEGKGKNVVVVGGSNGAAQAALNAARTAKKVTVVSRSRIDKAMSDYQISALRNNPRIEVIEGDEIAALDSHEGMPKKLTLKSGQEVDCNALGIFVGGAPKTEWLPTAIRRDHGKIVVNDDLETDIPGVFAVGDNRVGSIGRIGAAVGDGQLAERGTFQYFEKLKKGKKDPKRFQQLPAMVHAEDKHATWDAFIDELFDLDRQHPYLGQLIEDDDEVRTLGEGAGHPFHGNQWTKMDREIEDRELKKSAISFRVIDPVPLSVGTQGLVTLLIDRARVLKGAAERLDFPPEKLKIESYSRRFNVAGRTFEEGGHFNPQTGEIVLEALHLARTTNEDAELMFTHEVTHRDWNEVFDYTIGEPGGPPPKMDLEPADVPSADKVRDILSEESQKLQDTDGVTEYSRAYWKAVPRPPKEPKIIERPEDKMHPWMDASSGELYRTEEEARKAAGKVLLELNDWPPEDYDEKFNRAVNETLAEISKLELAKAYGRGPGHYSAPPHWNDPHPIWRDLHVAVKQTAKEIRAARQAEKKTITHPEYDPEHD